MEYTLNIKEVTYALSEALDFVGIDDILHGKRVAYMAAEVSKKMPWGEDVTDELMFTGMLHDCGVSSTDVHTHLVSELDWKNSQTHSIRGEELLKKTKIYNKFATYIRYHHTHWHKLPEELTQKEKDITNLIYLVDRVDAIRAQEPDAKPENVQATIQKHSGTLFSPQLVEAFIDASSHSSFWFYLESDALSEYITDWVETGSNDTYTFLEIKEIALMFSAIVDAKSVFTFEHSIGVANLSKYLAELFQLPQESCEEVELAGLLHDLGKLRVEDAILDKPGKLNAEERLKMDRHGFDSYIVIRHIKGFKRIAHIASLHHETLDAKGYPYALTAEEIPFEARLIAVADIFQALIQDRPYRAGLSMQEAYQIISDMCEDGKLDFDIVTKLKENLQSCYENATINYDVKQVS